MIKHDYTRILNGLLLAVGLLIIFHISMQAVARMVGPQNLFVNDVAARFGLDNELSIPTWFASMLALASAAIAWLAAHRESSPQITKGWQLLAFIGLMISLDEMAALHELALQGLHILAQFGEEQTFTQNAWLLVLPFIVIGLVAAGLYVRRLFPSGFRKRLLIATAVYLSGALVVEYAAIQVDKASILYNFGLVVVEEGLELVGLWLFLRAVLLQLQTHKTQASQTLPKRTS